MSLFDDLLGTYLPSSNDRIEPFARALPLHGTNGSCLLVVKRTPDAILVDLQAPDIDVRDLKLGSDGIFRTAGRSARGNWQCVGRVLIEPNQIRARADIRNGAAPSASTFVGAVSNG